MTIYQGIFPLKMVISHSYVSFRGYIWGRRLHVDREKLLGRLPSWSHANWHGGFLSHGGTPKIIQHETILRFETQGFLNGIHHF